MHEIFDFLFSQYKGYSTLHIILEAVAATLGVFSVVYSKRNNILVYPTGIISTAIYTYLLFKWNLYGDMIINAYYFIMSIYGWLLWSKKDADSEVLKISAMHHKDYINSIIIFVVSVIFVSGVYVYSNMFSYWWAYVDTFITGLFFVGMWLLAKRKIENWIFLIVGDIIAIPLFFYKGYTLSSILYVFLTIIAIYGYLAWKKILHSSAQTQ
jgi:nicotinamide mononucleotide transporter